MKPKEDYKIKFYAVVLLTVIFGVLLTIFGAPGWAVFGFTFLFWTQQINS